MVADYQQKIEKHFDRSLDLYNSLIDCGVAKECARFVLPLATNTRLYMTGTCRSWIHYINLRSAHGTQKEHMDIAEQCRDVFLEVFPDIYAALDWGVNGETPNYLGTLYHAKWNVVTYLQLESCPTTH